MKLYEIEQEILSCIDAETGEIIDVDKLEALNVEKDEKIENVALWIKNLQADAEAYKKEKLAFAERQKAAENKAESLKKWLAYVLQNNKFTTARCAVNFRKSQSVTITPEGLNKLMAEHDELLTYKAPEPNKTAIKAAIKNGLEIEGVTLDEKYSVNIK